jgi:hypothetical protein
MPWAKASVFTTICGDLDVFMAKGSEGACRNCRLEGDVRSVRSGNVEELKS